MGPVVLFTQQVDHHMCTTRSLILAVAALCAALTSRAQLADPEGIQAHHIKSGSATSAEAALPAAGEHANATLTYVITDAPNGTFGYDILSNGKLFVRQQNLPGQPGNNGCTTEADAEKLAQLVITKIRGGMMPPTVTKQELMDMHIIR